MLGGVLTRHETRIMPCAHSAHAASLISVLACLHAVQALKRVRTEPEQPGKAGQHAAPSQGNDSQQQQQQQEPVAVPAAAHASQPDMVADVAHVAPMACDPADPHAKAATANRAEKVSTAQDTSMHAIQAEQRSSTAAAVPAAASTPVGKAAPCVPAHATPSDVIAAVGGGIPAPAVASAAGAAAGGSPGAAGGPAGTSPGPSTTPVGATAAPRPSATTPTAATAAAAVAAADHAAQAQALLQGDREQLLQELRREVGQVGAALARECLLPCKMNQGAAAGGTQGEAGDEVVVMAITAGPQVQFGGSQGASTGAGAGAGAGAGGVSPQDACEVAAFLEGQVRPLKQLLPAVMARTGLGEDAARDLVRDLAARKSYAVAADGERWRGAVWVNAG